MAPEIVSDDDSMEVSKLQMEICKKPKIKMIQNCKFEIIIDKFEIIRGATRNQNRHTAPQRYQPD